MTNREWLSTLSDEEFYLWLYEKQSVYYKENPLTKKLEIKPLGNYSPTLWEITSNSTQSQTTLLNWFKEKRK